MINPIHVLTEANNKACDMLAKMTTPSGVTMQKTNNIIPIADLRDCSGLQFFDVKLVGAVVSYLHGSAFTISKLGNKDGVSQWSAPCFLQMNQIGVGLTVGYDDVKTIVVLGSESALQKAKGNRSLVGADLDVIVGKDSAVVQSDVSKTQLIPYSMADGALIDLSVKGGRVSTDKKLNEQLYGPGVTAEQILSGRIAPPEELRPLYNAIHRLVVEVGSAPA